MPINLDIDRIGALLMIEEKVRQHPQLKAIHDRIMMELVEHAGEAKDEQEAQRIEDAKKADAASAEKARQIEAVAAKNDATAAKTAKPIAPPITPTPVTPTPAYVPPTGNEHSTGRRA